MSSDVTETRVHQLKFTSVALVTMQGTAEDRTPLLTLLF